MLSWTRMSGTMLCQKWNYANPKIGKNRGRETGQRSWTATGIGRPRASVAPRPGSGEEGGACCSSFLCFWDVPYKWNFIMDIEQKCFKMWNGEEGAACCSFFHCFLLVIDVKIGDFDQNSSLIILCWGGPGDCSQLWHQFTNICSLLTKIEDNILILNKKYSV